MTSSLDDINAKVKVIAARNPVYAEIAQWVGDLLSATVEVSKNFSPLDLKLDFEHLPETWYRGKSLLSPEELHLDWEKTLVLYKHLVDSVREKEEGHRQAEGLLKAIEEKRNGMPVVMRAVLTSNFEVIEASAEALNVDSSVLTLLARLSLRPPLLIITQAISERLDLSPWNYGHCPVCGSVPGIGDLSGEGGKRSLHCSLCETVWSFPRLRCPFCENDNREELSYLRAENEDYLRVDICRRCNNYLKTIDLREISDPIILPLDDVATWHLDIIANKHLEDKTSALAGDT